MDSKAWEEADRDYRRAEQDKADLCHDFVIYARHVLKHELLPDYVANGLTECLQQFDRLNAAQTAAVDAMKAATTKDAA